MIWPEQLPYSFRSHVHEISLYGSTALVDLARLIYTQSVGLLGRGISRRKAATYTQNKRRHPCL
jgi:hypothetical protein